MWSSGSIGGAITVGPYASSTTNTLSVSPFWSGPGTSLPTLSVAPTTTYPYTISMERIGTPSYGDLLENLKPGTPWFKRGTIVKLQQNSFVIEKDDFTSTMYLKNSVFVYLGVEEDFENAKERHWFLSDTGKVVQHRGWVFDLGWRATSKKIFKEHTK
jgi:hypothetical protein